MFGLKPKPSSDEGIAEMETLWTNFERRFLWSQQRREEILHPDDCTMTTCTHPPVTGVRTKLDEIYQWENFARINYGTPVEDIQWT